MHLLGELAVDLGCSLKFWITFADTAPENLAIMEKLVLPLGLRLVPADVRFAPYVAAAELDVFQLKRPQTFQPWSARPIPSYVRKSLE